MKGLASVQDLPACQGCLKGGGNDQRRIRPCASGKKISDCNECGKQATCKNLEALDKVRKGGLAVCTLVRTDKSGQRQLKEKWTAEIRGESRTASSTFEGGSV